MNYKLNIVNGLSHFKYILKFSTLLKINFLQFLNTLTYQQKIS